jgi:hypothetical protein
MNTPLIYSLNDSILSSTNTINNYLSENFNGSLLQSLSMNISSFLSSEISKGNTCRIWSFQSKY